MINAAILKAISANHPIKSHYSINRGEFLEMAGSSPKHIHMRPANFF